MLRRLFGAEHLRVLDVPACERVAALTRAGLPFDFATSVAELYACLAARRAAPAGDRKITGTTTMEETLSATLTPVP